MKIIKVLLFYIFYLFTLILSGSQAIAYYFTAAQRTIKKRTMYKASGCVGTDSESDFSESEVTTDDEAGGDELLRETLLACAMLKLDSRAPVARIKARRKLEKRREALSRMPVDEVVKFIEGECSSTVTGAPQTSTKSKRKHQKKKKKNRQANQKSAPRNGGPGKVKPQQAQVSTTVKRNCQSDTEVLTEKEDGNEVCPELKCMNKFDLMGQQVNLLSALTARSDENSNVASCQTLNDSNPSTHLEETEKASDSKSNSNFDQQNQLIAAPSTKSKARVCSAISNGASDSYRFDADHHCKLACIDCIASLKANGMVELCQLRDLSTHVCSQTLLLAVPRVAASCSSCNADTGEWSLVRETPYVSNAGAPLSYLMCEHVTRGSAWMCTAYPFCRLPHNDAERTAWLKASTFGLDISAFIASRRAVLPLENALANFFSLYRGRFLLGCRTCFVSGRYSPRASSGFSCEPQVDAVQSRELLIRHSWCENECLLHRKGQRFAIRPIEPRPKSMQEHCWHYLERYSLCENGVRCSMPRCTSAHTRVELAVWRLERTYSALTRAELVDRSAMHSDAANVDPERDTKETNDEQCKNALADLDCEAEGLEFRNEIDPADILPRDGRKKATMISMALEQDDDENDEYRFEVKLTRREQRELRKLERRELMEEQRRRDALRHQKLTEAASSSRTTSMNSRSDEPPLTTAPSASFPTFNIPTSTQSDLPTQSGTRSFTPAAISNPFIRPIQIALAQPQPSVVRSTTGFESRNAFVLEAEYNFRLVCIECIKSVTPLGEVEFDIGAQAVGGPCHVCQQTLLVVLAQNRSSLIPRWSLIRDLPNSGTSTNYALCGHVTAGRRCPKLLFCDSPHNEDERLIWSNVRLGYFDIATFISRHRKFDDTFKPALARLLREYHGRFAFLCRACYMNTSHRVLAGPCPNGLYCNNPSVAHPWEENACMVHCRSETQFGIRPIEMRPLATHAWQHLVRYSLCNLGIRCSDQRCMSAHTKVELAVWRFERAFLECTRQMLVDCSSEFYETSLCNNVTATSCSSKPKSQASSSSNCDRLTPQTVPESVDHKWNLPSPASDWYRETTPNQAMSPSNPLTCHNLELHNQKVGSRTTKLSTQLNQL